MPRATLADHAIFNFSFNEKLPNKKFYAFVVLPNSHVSSCGEFLLRTFIDVLQEGQWLAGIREIGFALATNRQVNTYRNVRVKAPLHTPYYFKIRFILAKCACSLSSEIFLKFVTLC